jgi:hypothetical protein
MPSPVLWGNEATCRERFGSAVSPLSVTRHMYPFIYPFSPAKVAQFFFDYYGPSNRAYASLTGDAKQALNDDFTALWTRNNIATDGTTHVEGEYIQVIGTRV